jgi:hypothetical protein
MIWSDWLRFEIIAEIIEVSPLNSNSSTSSSSRPGAEVKPVIVDSNKPPLRLVRSPGQMHVMRSVGVDPYAGWFEAINFNRAASPALCALALFGLR